MLIKKVKTLNYYQIIHDKRRTKGGQKEEKMRTKWEQKEDKRRTKGGQKEDKKRERELIPYPRLDTVSPIGDLKYLIGNIIPDCVFSSVSPLLSDEHEYSNIRILK